MTPAHEISVDFNVNVFVYKNEDTAASSSCRRDVCDNSQEQDNFFQGRDKNE